MHRNKYMEGARRKREEPLISRRMLWLLIGATAAGYTLFRLFVADIKTEDGSGVIAELIWSITLIGVVVIAAIAVGSLIALIKGSRSKASLLDRIQTPEDDKQD